MKEKDLKKIRAIAFDFGGTLDIPGVHWFDFLWNHLEDEMAKHGVTKEQYWEAYVGGELGMEILSIPEDLDLKDTITMKLGYQFKCLAGCYDLDLSLQKRCALVKTILACVIPQIKANLQTASMIFKALSGNYDLSIVSNYYGNLETILKDAHIFDYLDRLIDSTVVGIRKPDPAIWKMAMDQSGVNPEEFLIIGDSMKNDILPAQSLGCPTILVTKSLPPEEYKGDWVSSLEMLAKILNITLTEKPAIKYR